MGLIGDIVNGLLEVLGSLLNILIYLINGLIIIIGLFIKFIFAILPESPFSQLTAVETPEGVELGYITWLIPFPTMILHFATFLVAIAAYYVFRFFARWIKLVRS